MDGKGLGPKTVSFLFNTLTTRPEREALAAWSQDYNQADRVVSRMHENLDMTTRALAFSGVALVGSTVWPAAGAVVGLVALAFAALSQRKYAFVAPTLPVIKHTGALMVIESKLRSEAAHTASVFRHPEDYPPDGEIVKNFWDKSERLARGITGRRVALEAACRRYDRPPLYWGTAPPGSA